MIKWIPLFFIISTSSSALAHSVEDDGFPDFYNQMICLAKNIYFEARNQSHDGKVAVAFVTLNRVKSKRYPNTICDVVKQGYKPGKMNCQFSWYCDGKPDEPANYEIWIECIRIASQILLNPNKFADPTHESTHYHADYVKPYWSDALSYRTKIDNHIFYSYK